MKPIGLIRRPKTGLYTWLFLITALAFILFLRDPLVFLRPSLPVEDGRDIFAYFYEHRSFFNVFRFKAGYIPLFPNLMGYLAIRIPTRLIPYAFTLIPLALTLASYSLFFAKRYRAIIPSDLIRAVVCTLMALAPVGQFPIYSAIDYSIWNGLLFVVLASLLHLPRQKGAKILVTCLILIFCCSNPVSLVAFPVFLYKMIKDRNDPFPYGFIAAVILGYFLFAVRGSASAIGGSAGETILRLLGNGAWCFVYVVKLTFRVVFGWLSFAEAERGTGITYAAFALLAAWIMRWFWQSNFARSRREIVLLLFYYIVGITFISIAGRGPVDVGLMNWHMRYIYIQSMLIFILAGMMLSAILEELYIGENPGNAVGHSLSSLGIAKRVHDIRLGLLCFILIYYVVLNQQIGLYRMDGFKFRQEDSFFVQKLENGAIVADFFRRLEASERNTELNNTVIVANKLNDWSFRVRPRHRVDARPIRSFHP
jgi:hypothetical protein